MKTAASKVLALVEGTSLKTFQKALETFAETDDTDGFLKYLEDVDQSLLETAMSNNNTTSILFPSGWHCFFDKKVPYPGKLAQALVKSRAAESITDITNVYYAGRSITKEAYQIFLKDVIQRAADGVEAVFNWSPSGAEELPDGLQKWKLLKPKDFKAFLAAFPADAEIVNLLKRVD